MVDVNNTFASLFHITCSEHVKRIMDKDTLRANRQKALIQDTFRLAFKDTVGEHTTVHPFVLAVQALRREVEFMEPFTVPEMQEMFAVAEPTYKSATSVLADAEEKVFGDSDVASEADQMLPLVEYHVNLLKIHRLLFTRQVEGYGLIPPAPPALQKQVVRTYEALGQLTDVLASLVAVPRAATGKRSATGKSPVRTRKATAKPREENEEPLELRNRVSPFITDGSKKSTVAIDGVLWPRFV